ncbi:sulfotransferase family protein [Synechococcus sp. RS9915]|nr:sulfotransferase family protein [Synechococcus sp. RS9915]
MLSLLLISGCPRSGTTALFTELTLQQNKFALFPEYDLPSLINQFDHIFKKESNILSKSWISNIDNSGSKGQKVGEYVKFVPQRQYTDFLLRSIYTLAPAYKVNSFLWYGEKYPRHYLLNYDYLASNGFCILNIILCRNPFNVVSSYKNRTYLKMRKKDKWRYNAPMIASRHWLETWLLSDYFSGSSYTNHYIKYEDLGSNESLELLKDVLKFPQLSFKHIKIDSSYKPQLSNNDLKINFLLTNLSIDWDKYPLITLRASYTRMYFLSKLLCVNFLYCSVRDPYNSLLITLLVTLPSFYLRILRIRYNCSRIKSKIASVVKYEMMFLFS